MLISLAICTWNRAGLLRRTLEAMRGLEVPAGVDWELLVVDNNSTDETPRVLQEMAATSGLPLRPLSETRQGHSHARNCGVAAARGDLVVWTDDDVVVGPGWLAAYAGAVRSFPEAAFFGGPVRPDFEVEPPDWVRRDLGLLGGPFALLDLGPEVRWLTPEDPAPIGANMAFKREALAGRLFDPALGRVGTGLESGDDTALIEDLIRQGARGVWVGTAPVDHHVPERRMTWSYLQPWFERAAASHVRARRPPGPDWFGVPRYLWRRWGTAHAARLGAWATGRPEPTAGRIERARVAGAMRECRLTRRRAVAG